MTHSRSLSPWRGWAFCLLACAICIAHGAATKQLGRTPPVDYREYITSATQLLRHGTITSPLILSADNTTPSNIQPPAYTALIAVVYRLFGVESFAATLILQLINIAAIGLAVRLTYSVGCRLGGVSAGRLAAAITAVHPGLIRFSTYLWDTSLITLAAILCISIAARWLSAEGRFARWFLFGLLLGAVAMLNPALTATYPFLVLWPALDTTRSRRAGTGRLRGPHASRDAASQGPATRVFAWRAKPVACAVLLTIAGWLIAITPWTIRNYVHFDKLSYIRGSIMLELWLGFCPEAEESPAEAMNRQFPLKDEALLRHVAEIGEAAYFEECGHKVREILAADRTRAVRMMLIRVVDYWTSHALSLPLWSKSAPSRSLSSRAGIIFMMAETVALILGLSFARRISSDVRWLMAILISFSLTYCITHFLVRYRTPMEPVLAIVIALLVVDVAGRILDRKNQPAPIRSDSTA